MLFVFRNGGIIGKEYNKLTHFIEKGFIHLPVLLCYMISDPRSQTDNY